MSQEIYRVVKRYHKKNFKIKKENEIVWRDIVGGYYYHYNLHLME